MCVKIGESHFAETFDGSYAVNQTASQNLGERCSLAKML